MMLFLGTSPPALWLTIGTRCRSTTWLTPRPRLPKGSASMPPTPSHTRHSATEHLPPCSARFNRHSSTLRCGLSSLSDLINLRRSASVCPSASPRRKRMRSFSITRFRKSPHLLHIPIFSGDRPLSKTTACAHAGAIMKLHGEEREGPFDGDRGGPDRSCRLTTSNSFVCTAGLRGSGSIVPDPPPVIGNRSARSPSAA